MALGFALLANVAAVAGVLLAWKSHQWQKEYDEPQVEITRVFTTGPSTPVSDPARPWRGSGHDQELRVEVVNSGNREVYIRKVTVEGAGQPAMTLLQHPHPEPTPLARGDRRIYGRPISDLQRFERQKGVQAVVRSNAGGGTGVLARRYIPASWWP